MMPLNYDILYEDNHLLIVNKPAGMLVQGDRTGDQSLIEHYKGYIKKKYNKPGAAFLGLVHRIDRPVSGAVALAKTSKALERMNKLFQKREFHKTYCAIVKNSPPEASGQLIHWLNKDPKANKSKAHNSDKKGGQKAELEYEIIGKSNGYYILKINPLTGRPHQIRVQLASIGCPIRGDLKYGFKKANEDGNINLHAIKQRFVHPVKQEVMEIVAPVPRDNFWNLFEDLIDSKLS